MTRQQFKRRLVGAIVLVSLAVIFLPMLLDRRANDDQLGEVIPQRDIPPFDKPATRPSVEPDIQPIAPSPAPAASPAPAPTAAKPAPVSAGATGSAEPKTWVVQVGSFAKSANAAKVADKLRAAGFDTVVDKVKVKGQTLYRVQVGPESDRGRAERLRLRIRQKLKMDGTVHLHQAG
jgi:DedD protein